MPWWCQHFEHHEPELKQLCVIHNQHMHLTTYQMWIFCQFSTEFSSVYKVSGDGIKISCCLALYLSGLSQCFLLKDTSYDSCDDWIRVIIISIPVLRDIHCVQQLQWACKVIKVKAQICNKKRVAPITYVSMYSRKSVHLVI